jgi:(p)ppGpp synthase/HD superfamily hydrolase
MIASEKITEKTRLAQAICLTAHSAVNQKRKYTGDPYWTHPFRVASICLAHNLNEKAICAAYLHDVVEDTGVSLVDIEMMVGKEIADIVFFLPILASLLMVIGQKEKKSIGSIYKKVAFFPSLLNALI